MTVLTIDTAGAAYRIADPGGRIGSKLVNGEPYERRLLADIARRGLTGTAFDIGAHVGNHALYLAAVCGFRVYAFEPNPDTFAQLAANIALNPGLDITAMPYAAGDRTTRARHAGRMRLKVDRGGIPVRRIDDLLDVADLAVVKVDVEGMEPEALAGMERHLRRTHPLVYAETHTDHAEQRIAAVLEPLGYRPEATIAMGSVMRVWS